MDDHCCLAKSALCIKLSTMGELSNIQKAIVEHNGSCLVMGGPGTGKTLALVEKVVRLIQSGVAPQEIHVIAFTYYSWQVLLGHFQKRLGAEVASQINIGTCRIFAQNQMEKDMQSELVFASDKQSRRSLRQAMREVDFKGSAVEAEHIIRHFKSMARKPAETAKHYDLFLAYKSYCEMDRYDILRRHIVGMRQGEMKLVPMRYVMIDNFQDITHIQLLWLLEHMKAGAQISAFGDDDLCVFKRDGALGSAALKEFSEQSGVKSYMLAENYRFSQSLGEASHAIIQPIQGRLEKDAKYSKSIHTNVTFEALSSAEEELLVLAEKIKAVPQDKRIGVIARTDWDALRIQKIFEKNGIEHSSFAHKVWEIPGAIMVIDLLSLLMNQASDVHLRNVLVGYGLNQQLIEMLFKGGLHAHNWLAEGAKLPKDVQLPTATLSDFVAVQRQLLGYFNLLKARVASPQEVFKAAAFDMIERMNYEDKFNALIGVDTLLNLKGPLKEVLPQIRQGKEPNMQDRILLGPVRDMRNLEFDVVFLPLANEKVFPFSGYRVLPVDQGHDRRLFYMAITRAKSSLNISWYGEPSQYIQKLQQLL